MRVLVGYARLRIASREMADSRVASPGCGHCHSPVKGWRLARTHRHSSSYFYNDQLSLGSFRIYPKGENSSCQWHKLGRDSWAWYRAVHAEKCGPRPGKIGSCQPVVLAGRVGSNPTPGASTNPVSAGEILGNVRASLLRISPSALQRTRELDGHVLRVS